MGFGGEGNCYYETIVLMRVMTGEPKGELLEFLIRNKIMSKCKRLVDPENIEIIVLFISLNFIT